MTHASDITPRVTHCNTLTVGHTLHHVHCTTHTATHKLHHTHCNTHTATHSLQHTLSRSTAQQAESGGKSFKPTTHTWHYTYCTQHAHCNTHTATRFCAERSTAGCVRVSPSVSPSNLQRTHGTIHTATHTLHNTHCNTHIAAHTLQHAHLHARVAPREVGGWGRDPFQEI